MILLEVDLLTPAPNHPLLFTVEKASIGAFLKEFLNIAKNGQSSILSETDPLV